MRFISQMNLAIAEAKKASIAGEVPVGAVIVDTRGKVVASAGNRTRRDLDPTAHAEILAIRKAAKIIGNDRLVGCTIYVTLEPCTMCAGAAFWTRIGKIVYGASDERRGYKRITESVLHPSTEVTGGVLEDEASDLIKTFFQNKRR